ncbi:MAG: cysteine synthase A [Emcibacteraceae bacterium]|nr:cysteine synthase A [Emcibacteraceae bacterium]
MTYQTDLQKIGRGRIYNDVSEIIGNTPIVRLSRLMAEEGLEAEILAKIEYVNPAGSVKDRPAMAMIQDAIDKGLIGPNTEIVEATSGNNGVACAWASAMRGIPITICMPEHMSIERRRLLKLYGANVILTAKNLGTKGAIDKAAELQAQNPNMIQLGQFENLANPTAHKNGTAEEIWTDTQGNVDYFVAGIGTGGTFTGVTKALKERNPNLKGIAVEPASCPVLSKGQSGVHKLQGLSSGHIPDVLEVDIIDEVLTVGNDEAIAMARRLARLEGTAVGLSSGAAAVACVNLAKRPEMKGKRIVTIFADGASRYFSTEIFEGFDA